MGMGKGMGGQAVFDDVNEKLKEVYELSILYDFYGELLTEKQKQVYEMHYQNDLSLSEIAEELSISRQAVRDQLLRTEKILQGYEETLHLISRFQEQRRAVEEMKAVMEAMEREPLDGKLAEAVSKMKKIADGIIF